MNDLALAGECPVRLTQRRLGIAVDLQSPRELGQRLGDGRRMPQGFAEGDCLMQLGHRLYRLASKGKGKGLER